MENLFFYALILLLLRVVYYLIKDIAKLVIGIIAITFGGLFIDNMAKKQTISFSEKKEKKEQINNPPRKKEKKKVVRKNQLYFELK